MLLDPATEFKLSKVYPDVGERWKRAAYDLWNTQGRQIRVTDGYRDFQTQMAIYMKGRSKDLNGNIVISNPKLIVSHSQGGESFHNFGLALDSCFIGDDPYLEHMDKEDSDKLWLAFGEAIKKQGMTWGGEWKGSIIDRPHCEMKYGLSIHDFLMIYEGSGLLGVFAKCEQILKCGYELV